MNTPLHDITPLWHSLPLSRVAGLQIHLKVEALQPIGSFKIRGIGRLCSLAAAKGARRFVSSSGGNAGIATAYAGCRLGIPVSVFTFANVPKAAIARMREFGADVVEAGATWDAAHQAAGHLAETENAVYIHPFDHPDLWQGHSTLIDEHVDASYVPDVLVCSVCGGGLLTGLIQGLARHQLHPHIITVETHHTASLKASLEAGRLVRFELRPSVAKTLAASQVAEQAFVSARDYGVEPIAVSDQEALDACRRFALDHRLLVEPSAGAALAVAYERLGSLKNYQRALIVVCGGAGISLKQDIFDY